MRDKILDWCLENVYFAFVHPYNIIRRSVVGPERAGTPSCKYFRARTAFP